MPRDTQQACIAHLRASRRTHSPGMPSSRSQILLADMPDVRPLASILRSLNFKSVRAEARRHYSAKTELTWCCLLPSCSSFLAAMWGRSPSAICRASSAASDLED